MLTKKTFNAIASRIEDVRHTADFIHIEEARRRFANAVALALLEDNPKFDVEKFFMACGVYQNDTPAA